MKRFHEWMAERGRSIENGTAMQLADNLIEYVEEGMAKYEPVMEERFQFINKATGRPELPGPDHETEVRRYVHPAFPYENPGPAAATDEAIERAAEALHIERNRQWEAIRPDTRNPLIAVTWAEENEPFKERLRQEVRIVLAAVTSASTEAMLNHMADVHLTPTAEKERK